MRPFLVSKISEHRSSLGFVPVWDCREADLQFDRIEIPGGPKKGRKIWDFRRMPRRRTAEEAAAF